MDELVIGIDLGGTNSCAAIFTKGRVEILENEDGDRITPSYVSSTDEDAVVVGRDPRSFANAKPAYGIYEVKKLIGRKFDNSFVQKVLSYLPYKLRSVRNKPVVVAENKHKINKKTADERCAYMLGRVKKDVESKLGVKVDKAVVTVPAYFNIEQREATLDACREVGLTVIKLFSEPTAAALTYYFENDVIETTNSIVYDLGGGTFDVAILQKSAQKIDILAIDGDTRLGGYEFDNLIADYVCSFIQINYKFKLKTDSRTTRRLLNGCEEAKKSLSRGNSTTIKLLGLVPKHSVIEIPLSKAQFEDMIMDVCEKTIDIMNRCIDVSPIKKGDVTEVILSGGSTRIPLVQNLVSQFFNGKVLNNFVNPDECVAKGAALQAAMLSSHPDQKIRDISITDVTPLSIGVLTLANLTTILIKRNTQIPTSNTVGLVSTRHRQTSILFDIYEGERTDARKNHFLGCLDFTDLTPAPPGLLNIDVTANLDRNGVLTITAKELLTGKTKDLKIVYTRGKRSETDIQDAITSAKLAKEEDGRYVMFAKAKGNFMKYCINIMYQLDVRKLQSLHQIEYNKCEEIRKQATRLEMDDLETVEGLKAALREVCSPLIERYKLGTV